MKIVANIDIGIALEAILPKARIKARLIDRIGFGSDAGFYALTPQAVVMPESIEEIKSLFLFSQHHQVPITFRTGGTSLSGQAITDGILVELSQYWRKISVENDGKQIRVQPGVIGAMANAHLKKYKTKIGPDPSSIASAMIGGILSNNSSGMCCGVDFNSYHTLKYISFVLPNGDYFNTEIEADYARFNQHPLGKGLVLLQDRIKNNAYLSTKIRKKYKTKNTVGYGLNAFIDYEHPLDIFAHLLVGAEGTLAFIAEAVLHTIPDFGFKATALLYFEDIATACRAVVAIKSSGAEAIELMDRASLSAIENIHGIPENIKLLSNSAAALLIEYQTNDKEMLATSVANFHSLAVHTTHPVQFTQDAKEQALLWKVRKGLFPSVGAVRAQGTTVILEDIAFPVEQMANAIADLQGLFKKYHYANAIIFGHAKDGNIHFVITQTFNEAKEIDRYDGFMKEVIDLVITKYDGALKAEHGTGRNMAPFVETEWGTEAYHIMAELKALVDPHNLLNPDVIINADKKAHLKKLKKMPVVEAEIDKCIECGACEPKCPSKDVTLSPRRRIVIRREMQSLKENHHNKQLKELISDYEYEGLETCAVDGLCAIDCPVSINTGNLVKRLRKESHSSTANGLALWIAKNFKLAEVGIHLALQSGKTINIIFGKNAMMKLTAGIKKVFSTFTLWNNQLAVNKPYYSNKINNNASNFDKAMAKEMLKAPLQHGGAGEEALVLDKNITPPSLVYLYFSACLSRMLGNKEIGKSSLQQTFLNVAKKANVHIVIPKNIAGTCCGQAFSSKGYQAAYEYTINNTINKLYDWSDEGKMPIVLDLSSCTQTLHECRPYLNTENQIKFDKLVLLDTVDFLHDHILPLVDKTKIQAKSSIVLHPVCSLHKLGTNEKFRALAELCATSVVMPLHAGCCGMAGDRGFFFPELTQSATKEEAKEANSQPCEGYYSSAKTCEIALSEAVGHNYESIVYLLDEVLN